MPIELLPPFRPLLGAPSYDGGGREVVGWLHCPRWRALLGWVELLVDRNVHGCLPYSTNPEPWPNFWWAVENAEKSHLSSPWYWGEVSEGMALLALARTLRDVRQVYPQVTPEQIHDALIEMGVF
ncbi:hypothetical protein PGN35_000495 [Nodosilinea sp. PGN35]|uniref:hypothetical protein n=1 Tax=Nodosilinea sp. PGN35 TaxID=3020489 RepID=UPI0023B2B879|nr:hypothetical protein [Nodosilinea sp. TSF1-S3]MDF0369107.1 hypothetical protein [Nodosilinea sp. TSF1-S3]